jgi:hypothetical protein
MTSRFTRLAELSVHGANVQEGQTIDQTGRLLAVGTRLTPGVTSDFAIARYLLDRPR